MTRSIPVYEVPPTTPPTAAEEPVLAQAVLDMAALAETPDGGFRKSLGPIADAYEAWLQRQQARLDAGDDGLADFRESGARALVAGRRALERIRRGLDLLDTDPMAAEAFRFANRAMALQRVHSIFATDNRRTGVKQPDFARLAELERPANRSWRHFQVAFLLLNLPDLADCTPPPGATPPRRWPTSSGSPPAAARPRPTRASPPSR